MNRKKRIATVLAAVLLVLAAAWHLVPDAFRPVLIAANRALSGLSEHTVAAAGHEIHYLAGGAGEPVILLHGIFAEKDHWVDFARHLAPGLRVIVPDLPGFGESGRKDGESYDYGTQVRRLRELLDALGTARVHLAGSSMGGTIAALFAVQHPERVASVAFIGAPHGIRSPRPSAMDRLIDAGQAPLVVRTPEQFEAMLSLVFARRPFLPGPVLHAARERAMAEADSDLRIWQRQVADRYLLDAHIARLAQPVLALWGGAEQVFDPTGAEALRAKLPGAHVQVLPGLGHLPMMEAPAATARAYNAFLERQRGPKAALQ
jgi:pimeloyl-ACP methyl ester carboxylesterase